MMRFFSLIVVVVLSLTLVILRLPHTEDDIQGEVYKNPIGGVTEIARLSNTGTNVDASLSGTTLTSSGISENIKIDSINVGENQDFSGINVKIKRDYTLMNSSAKIYDAYISNELVEIGKDDHIFGEELSEELKNSLKRIKYTEYLVGNNQVFFSPLGKVNFEAKNIKGILPFKGFTGASAFASDGKNIIYWGKKVENGDINSLKFKVFGNGAFIAGDKYNIYLYPNKIINGVNIYDVEYLPDGCLTNMKLVFCYDFFGYTIIDGADPYTFLLLFQDVSYSISWYKDKNFIYLNGIKKQYLDVSTFEVLDDLNYAKDKNGVYYFGEKIEGADPIRFSVSRMFGLDGKNIIYEGKVVPGIDYNSFSILHNNLIKDKYGVYEYRSGEFTKIKGIDPSTTISINNSLTEKDVPFVKYIKDKDYVYYTFGGGYKIINSADVTTFKPIIGDDEMYRFAKDKDYVYFHGKKIDGIDSETFKIISNFYIKDKNYVFTSMLMPGYDKFERIDNADPNTFGLFTGSTIPNRYTRDSNNLYFDGNIINGADINTFTYIGELYGKDEKAVYFEDKKLEGINPNGFDLDKYLKEKQGPM